MKYIRLHKCQDESSFMAEADRGRDEAGVENKKAKSLMEIMHRVISSRAIKSRSAEAKLELKRSV